ncbi:MAG: tRNA (adenosine(37)-N6)-dimethylallyltransferase MiaA [Candidatus Gracilibacteria bacterium]|nr:tRNA (adenosine(37)-N6)-dimethylallyltransferase MiaA [Candidatus Gracilibacteria bacterium]
MNPTELIQSHLAQAKKPLICLIGPTASGKTALSLELAKKFNGEIVSADSRQIYRGMDIGTAKISKEERQGVPHHLLDIIDPDQDFSVAEFKRLAVEKIEDILQRGKVPFLVGGTMLYIDAVTKNFEIPEVEPDLELRKKLEAKELQLLVAELAKLDPEAAKSIDTDNPRRVSRALEYCLKTGKNFSEAGSKGPKLFDELILGIDLPREELYKRIDARVEEQLKNGLLAETKELAAKYTWDLPSMSGIGYKQMGMYLRGDLSLEEALEILKIDTRRYAKRQLTWWRGDERIRWISDSVR